MRALVRWAAKELLSSRGFADGNFVASYELCHGRIVAPENGIRAPHHASVNASFVPGDDYPDYVFCLVYLLSLEGLRYLVLSDPEVGSHNVDRLDSFVFDGRLYIVEARGQGVWFMSLPPALQRIFESTSVTVEIDADQPFLQHISETTAAIVEINAS